MNKVKIWLLSLLLIFSFQLLSQSTILTFEIDSICKIEQSFDSNGQIRSHVELRKNKQNGAYFLYHKNGQTKLSGSYIQVIDTISILEEDLLSGEITFLDTIVDNSPRKIGTWLTYDTLGRVIKLEKFQTSIEPTYVETYQYEKAPYLKIQKNLLNDTTLNLEYNLDGKLTREYQTIQGNFYGLYLEYHSNGNLKIKGKYNLVLSAEMEIAAEEDLLTGEITYSEVSKGMISQKKGKWTEYNEEGQIIKTTSY